MLAPLPDGVIALAAGTVLALGAGALVLGPLLRPSLDGSADAARAVAHVPHETPAVDALREIEFDRETGKLSDRDYAELKATYTGYALAELRAAEGRVADDAASLDDAAEAEIRRWQGHVASCPEHGPRPEPDAAYCSDCGRYLAGGCVACGAAATVPGQRFCADCGTALAA